MSESQGEQEPVREMDRAQLEAVLDRLPPEHRQLFADLRNNAPLYGNSYAEEQYVRINEAQVQAPMEGMRPQAYTGILDLNRAIVRVDISKDGLISVGHAA